MRDTTNISPTLPTHTPMSGSRPESAVVGVLVDDERTIGGVEKDSFAEGKEQVTGEKTDVPGELLDYVDVVTPDGGLRAWLVVLAVRSASQYDLFEAYSVI